MWSNGWVHGIGRPGTAPAERPGPRLAPVAVVFAFMIALTAFAVAGSGRAGPVRQWCTVFLALMLQALPFLVLGTLLGGAVSGYLRPALVARIVPRRPAVAVGVAGLAGAALPGCECSSVPLARRLAARGVPPAAALSFLLAAPAVNPVVVVATLVAFPGRPEMAAARWLAALATAVTVGWLWTRWGRPLPPPRDGGGASPRQVLLHTVVDDTSSSIGYLAIGAASRIPP